MKKIKTGILFIILIFFALVVYQNKEYFFLKQSLIIDLKFGSLQWIIPEFFNLGYFIIFFLIGFLVAGYMWAASKLKARKNFKLVKYAADSYRDQVASLQTELDKFKNDPYINTETNNDSEEKPQETQTT